MTRRSVRGVWAKDPSLVVAVRHTPVEQLGEKSLHDAMVIFSGSNCIVVEVDAQAGKRLDDLRVIARHQFGGSDALAVGVNGDWRAMRIAARHHQHVMPGQTMIARKNIARQKGANDLPNMRAAAGVGPRDADENTLGGGRFSGCGVLVRHTESLSFTKIDAGTQYSIDSGKAAGRFCEQSPGLPFAPDSYKWLPGPCATRNNDAVMPFGITFEQRAHLLIAGILLSALRVGVISSLRLEQDGHIIVVWVCVRLIDVGSDESGYMDRLEVTQLLEELIVRARSDAHAGDCSVHTAMPLIAHGATLKRLRSLARKIVQLFRSMWPPRNLYDEGVVVGAGCGVLGCVGLVVGC